MYVHPSADCVVGWTTLSASRPGPLGDSDSGDCDPYWPAENGQVATTQSADGCTYVQGHERLCLLALTQLQIKIACVIQPDKFQIDHMTGENILCFMPEKLRGRSSIFFMYFLCFYVHYWDLQAIFLQGDPVLGVFTCQASGKLSDFPRGEFKGSYPFRT